MKENNFGKTISQARKQKELSQESLAKVLHVSRQSISNWENNINIPDLLTLEKLCKTLNLNFSELSTKLGFYPHNKKTYIKIMNLLIISMLLITFFLFFLIKHKNKFEVYSISIDNNNIVLTNGIFIKSNVNYYFQLGNIEFIDNDNPSNYKVVIYIKNENGVRLLLEKVYSDSIILNEKYGYSEYFDNEFDINDVYMDLIQIDNKKKVLTYKLNFIQIFKNDRLFYFKNDKINNQNEKEYFFNIKIDEELLLNNNYIFNNYDYIKEVKDGTFQYNLKTNKLFFYNDNTNLSYDFKNGDVSCQVVDLETEKMILDFNFNNDKIICYSQDCKNYEVYLNIIKEEVQSLINNDDDK